MIINYLVKALCEKESVYVNNLGLFKKEYEPAHISGDMITPPGHKVVFDPEYYGNGFAFTMFVSQKGSMLITDATSQIDQWVKQLKNALDNNKSVSFENFGTFSKNGNGTITFMCDRINELNLEYEGMEPVSFRIQKDEKEEVEEETTIEKTAQTEETKTENETVIEEKTEVETEVNDNHETSPANLPEEDSDKHIADKADNGATDKITENNSDVNIPDNDSANTADNDNDDNSGDSEPVEGNKKKPWVIILIILLIVAVLAAAAYYFRGELKELYQQYFGPTTENKTEEQTNENITPNNDIIDTTMMIDSIALAGDSLSEMDKPEISEEEIPVPETATKFNAPLSRLPDGEKFYIDFEEGKHYVIVGSFRSEREARQHIQELKIEKYNPKVVLQQGSKHLRICVGVFDTEAEADNYGRGIGINYWVLK